jgi:hypothetical protein
MGTHLTEALLGNEPFASRAKFKWLVKPSKPAEKYCGWTGLLMFCYA